LGGAAGGADGGDGGGVAAGSFVVVVVVVVGAGTAGVGVEAFVSLIAPWISPLANFFNAVGVVIRELLDRNLSTPAPARKVPIRDKTNCPCGISEGFTAACAAPNSMPASAPVMRALPCFLPSNFSPDALNDIQEDRNPPAIPAMIEPMTAAVGSTIIF
jgi:hypothetical protein